jgi:hypothetical protein
MANKIQLRRDTASNWSRINPILADGEPGLDITNNKIKMGDGTTAWNSLTYLASPEHARLVNGLKVLTVEASGNVTMPNTVKFTSPSTGNAAIRPADTTNLQITTNDGGSTTSTWQFGNTGILTLTNGSTIDDGPNLFVTAADDTDIIFRTREAGLTNRDWVLGSNGNVTLPANTVITTEPGYTGNSFSITDIALSVNGTTVTTSTEHALTVGAKVKITNITTTTELNDNYYYIDTPASNQLGLYMDPNCSIPVDSSGYTPYVSHVGKGVSEYNGATTYVTEDPITNPTGLAGSITFDDNRCLVVSGSSDFWVGAYDNFTVEAYMKFTSADFNSGYAPMFGTNNNANGLSILTGPAAMGIFNGINGGAWLGGYFSVWGTIIVDTWHHIAFVRESGKVRLYIDGNKITASSGDVDNNYNEFPCNESVLVGRAVGYGCHGTQISNFRFVKGAALYTAPFTRPASPLTAVTGTKLLIIGNGSFADGSGTVAIPGDGSATVEIAGADLSIELTTPVGTDPGNVNISSGLTTLRVNGRDGEIIKTNPGGVFPINSSGQQDIELYAGSENTPFNNISPYVNVIYITQQDGYTNNGTHSLQLPEPMRPGMELTVVNDTPGNFNVTLFDGPAYTMMSWENIRLISVRDRGGYSYWWITGSFSW